MNELIVDTSIYNDPVGYTSLRNNGIVANIAKGGGSLSRDRLFTRHAAGTKAAGMYLGMYYWTDPVCDAESQAVHAAKLATEAGAHFICSDVEQWWADWSKWYQWRMGKLTKADVPVVLPKQIFKTAAVFRDKVKKLLPGVKFLNYSSLGFINTWCRDLFDLFGDDPFWLAQYPVTGPEGNLKRKVLCWDELKEKYLPIKEPYVPVDLADTALWQWTGDRFVTESVTSPLDINLFRRPESFSDWIGLPPPEPQDPPFKVMRLNDRTSYLNVRSQPNATCPILRVLSKQSVFAVENSYGTWAKLYGEPGFVHSAYIVPRIEL